VFEKYYDKRDVKSWDFWDGTKKKNYEPQTNPCSTPSNMKETLQQKQGHNKTR
jgi:hypothetical protein